MLKLKPEERPTTGDILKMPEILEKINELKIYPLQNYLNNQNSRLNSGKTRDNSITNNNNSFQTNNQYNNPPTSVNISMNKMVKNMSGNSIDPSVVDNSYNNANDQNNELTSINNNNPNTSRNVNKSEILNILNNNLNYFNQKKNEEKKFVLNTIRIPKTLGKLNDKLPESKYESDYMKRKKNFQGLSFPSQVLPMLKVRYTPKNNDNNNIPNSEKKNKINNNINNKNNIFINNSKSIELVPPTLLNNNNEIVKNKRAINEENIFLKNGKKNYYERANRFIGLNKFNTLKMMVHKDKPFNYKGQIDIIVEE